MKLSFALAAAFALAAPVLAQPPSTPIDWTKPVTGVDAPAPLMKAVEEVSITVLLDQVLRDAIPDDTAPPKPPPCEPPVTKARTADLPPPCAPPAN